MKLPPASIVPLPQLTHDCPGTGQDQASLSHLLDHFDHVTRLAGVEHVGIGSDADLEGRQPVIAELAHSQFLFAITDGLLRRGYTSAEITAILAGNFRRVLRQTLPASS